MLNVAVIRSVAYYLDQVAHSRADYYLGRGEAPGRWMGSLAGAFDLTGRVDPEALRTLLDGRHPGSGQALLSPRPPPPRSPARREGAVLGSGEAAQALGVSTRTLRRWAAAGREVWQGAQQATPERELRTPSEVLARLAELESRGGPARSSTMLLVSPQGGPGRRLEVQREEVERLLEGRRPPASRQGYDLVFRPAKGYSVLWALGPTELRRDLVTVHHEAVADALDYLERTSALTRATVTYGGRRVRMKAKGEGLVVAAFDHRESRAGDPLLHTHCLVANVTRLPSGRLGALEPSMLFRQQRAADAVYQATFRHLAEGRLGIASVPGPAPFPEPQGVPEEVIRHFSKRSEEIAAEVERLGSTSAAVRQLAALHTRRAKEVETRSEDLWARWRAEATELGFGEDRVVACLGRTGGRGATKAEVAELFAHLAGREGLTATAATFTRAEVIRALGERLGGACSGGRLVELANAFLASEAVIQVREHRRGRPRGRVLEEGQVIDDLSAARFSVPELASIESRLMAAARERGGPVLAPAVVDATLLAHPRLSAEQAEMVRAVCSKSPALIRPVVGLPGSGKTTATAALVDALSSGGVAVIGCAVTATAAAELARASGLSTCDTLARTLLDLEMDTGSMPHGAVVVVDEASTLPHRELDRLLSRVREAEGALVLVGDPHQHGSVGPGSFFSWLVSRGEAVPTLAANLRQRDVLDQSARPIHSLEPEREAARAMREGRLSDALHLREEAGLLVHSDTPAELHVRLVEEWALTMDSGDPMVVASNATRDRLTHLVRGLLDNAGTLSGPTLLAGGRQFRVGDWVVARRNHRRLRSADDPRWWVRNGASGRVVTV